MKVIFLDIDGVLNNMYYLIRKREKIMSEEAFSAKDIVYSEFDPIRMKILSQIINKTNAKIVLTSSWRFNPEVPEAFMRHGLEVYDVTPRDLENFRPDEINDWIDSHEVESYLILDDECSGYSEEQMKHAIITKECFSQEVRAEYPYYEGLQEKHINWAIQILNSYENLAKN